MIPTAILPLTTMLTATTMPTTTTTTMPTIEIVTLPTMSH
jgi:hypothetical protein